MYSRAKYLNLKSTIRFQSFVNLRFLWLVGVCGERDSRPHLVVNAVEAPTKTDGAEARQTVNIDEQC